MSILNSIIKIFVGNKAKKDLKEISPIVLSINSLEENYSDLSNDELRNKTNEFKKEIQSLKKPFQDKIDVLNGNISNESDIEKKEKLYNDIEEIDQNFLDELDIYLNKILPDAFCIIRETAKRFSKNEEVIVTANENDIKLSSEKNYITLNKDKAKWSNSWDAAGKNIIWDMVHYDVQLFGGIVLHKGKIAEMQTGEGKT